MCSRSHYIVQMILWNLRQGIDFHSDLSDNNQVRIPFFENADSHFNFRDYEKRVNAQKWWARSKGADISADRFTKGIYKTVEYDGDALSDDDEEAKELDETKVKDLLKSCSMTKCRQVILKLLNKVESRVSYMPINCKLLVCEC